MGGDRLENRRQSSDSGWGAVRCRSRWAAGAAFLVQARKRSIPAKIASACVSNVIRAAMTLSCVWIEPR